MAVAWLAVGLDPEVASFVGESTVPEHAELVGVVRVIAALERNPSLKVEGGGDRKTKDATARGKPVRVAFDLYPMMEVANILRLREFPTTPVEVRRQAHTRDDDTSVDSQRTNRGVDVASHTA